MLTIQVAGTGCPNCQKLEAMCREVVAENGIEAQIEKITDMNKFVELGVMLTPGLLLNGKLKSSGKIPTKSTLVHWIKESVGED